MINETILKLPVIKGDTDWLLSTNKNTFVFIGDINFNDDGTINEGGNSTVIPKSNILKLKEIKL